MSGERRPKPDESQVRAALRAHDRRAEEEPAEPPDDAEDAPGDDEEEQSPS